MIQFCSNFLWHLRNSVQLRRPNTDGISFRHLKLWKVFISEVWSQFWGCILSFLVRLVLVYFIWNLLMETLHTLLISHFQATGFLCLPIPVCPYPFIYTSEGFNTRQVVCRACAISRSPHEDHGFGLFQIVRKEQTKAKFEDLFFAVWKHFETGDFWLHQGSTPPTHQTHSHTHTDPKLKLWAWLSPSSCFVGSPHADLQCQQSVAEGHCFPQSHKFHRLSS